MLLKSIFLLIAFIAFLIIGFLFVSQGLKDLSVQLPDFSSQINALTGNQNNQSNQNNQTSQPNQNQVNLTEANLNAQSVFCPDVNCSIELTDFLDSANESIYCAFYSLNNDNVISKLKEKKDSGLKVGLILDNDMKGKNYLSQIENLISYNDNSNYLMHNKFCVVDANKIWIGSFNPTSQGVKSNNDILILENQELAKNAFNEFQEMQQGKFGPGSPANSTNLFSNVELRFCPEDNCKELLFKYLDKTKSSLHCLLFSFTFDEIAGKMLELKNKGVDVKIITESSQSGSEYSEFSFLKQNKTNIILDKNPFDLHNKMCIIDNQFVLTGSMNYTSNGLNYNDESLIALDDKEIALLYSNYFDKYWFDWTAN